ncbi:carbohydrate esterase family 3 protein [Xylariaceae sp. FL0594]|nr:carbohydrate esterase family 3 protein [Xylariaceae sp. FL0594]
MRFFRPKEVRQDEESGKMLLSASLSKFLTVVALLLVLIGLFTYNIVDLHQQLDSISANINNENKLINKINGNATPPQTGGPLANGLPLRIMFIGASITRGERSEGGRGYRRHIRETLTSWGNPVNLVGFARFGDWGDNDVEGYSAHPIRRVLPHALQAVPALRPNLVLVQVGTSDCFQNDQPAFVLSRYRQLADAIIASAPETTVILSTLVTTPNATVEACMLTANAQIRQVAADLIRENKRVALAEMHYGQGFPGRPLPQDIHADDKTHPTDEGYRLMGDIFLDKIREVAEKGFLERAVDNGIPDNGEDGRDVEDRLIKQAQADHPVANP